MWVSEESTRFGGNAVPGAPPNRCSPVNSRSLAPEAPADRGTSCSCALKLQNVSATSPDGSPRLITIHRLPSLKSTLIKSLRQFDRQRFDLRNAMNARERASNWRWGEHVLSTQSMRERTNVSGACGSGKVRLLKNGSYSRLRPSDT